MLRNFGLLVGGETIEEAFWMARNVMTGIDTQVTLSPTSLYVSVSCAHLCLYVGVLTCVMYIVDGLLS